MFRILFVINYFWYEEIKMFISAFRQRILLLIKLEILFMNLEI